MSSYHLGNHSERNPTAELAERIVGDLNGQHILCENSVLIQCVFTYLVSMVTADGDLDVEMAVKKAHEKVNVVETRTLR